MLKRKMLALLISVCTVFAVAVGFLVYAKVLANKAESASYECLQGDISALEGSTFDVVVETEKRAVNRDGVYSDSNYGVSLDTYSITVENGQPLFRLKTDNKAFYIKKEDIHYPYLSEILSIDSGIIHDNDVHKYITYNYMEQNIQLYSKDNKIYVCVYNPETRDRKDILIAESDNVKIDDYFVSYPKGIDEESAEFEGEIAFTETNSGIMFIYFDYEKNTNRFIEVSIDDKTEVLFDYEIEAELPEHIKSIIFDDDSIGRTIDDYDFYAKDGRIYMYLFNLFYWNNDVIDFDLNVIIIEKDKILFDGKIYNDVARTVDSYNDTYDEYYFDEDEKVLYHRYYLPDGTLYYESSYDEEGNLLSKWQKLLPIDFSLKTNEHTYYENVVSVNMRFDE